jgi:flagellar motor switch protein FliN/FliY
MTTEGTSAGNQSFSNAFFSALLSAASEATGSQWQRVDSTEADLTPDEIEPFRVKLALEGSLRGEFLLELNRADAAILAARLLPAPVPGFRQEHSDALLNLITGAGNAFCSEPGQAFGAFKVTVSAVSEPAVDRADVAQITAADRDGNRVSITQYINSELVDVLALNAHTRTAGEDIRRAIKASGGKEIAEPVNLGMVLDVELNVTLRFGQRKLTLREVLELTSGSVVELDRQVEEPVELLLDGMVIARGEAVVIDGNYGLRVTEVSQPLSSTMLR